MLMREEQQQKTELVDQVAERAAGRAGSRSDEIRSFTQQLYEHVPTDDVLASTLDELTGAALSLWELGQERTPGAPKIRLSRSDPKGHTAIEIVNDDMPFLVDSLVAELHRQNAEIL